MLDPAAVALKFGFLAVLYLFLLWTVRSAWRDLRRNAAVEEQAATADDATGMHVAARGLDGGANGGAPVLRVGTAAGLRSGSAYDLARGRCSAAATRRTSCSRTPSPPPSTPGSCRTARSWCSRTSARRTAPTSMASRCGVPQPLHVGDRIRIGDSEFTFER